MQKNTWIKLDSHPEIHVGQYIVPNFVSNSIALKLKENEFLIISPGEPLLTTWPNEWTGPNIKMHLLMPNSFHHLGIKSWQKAFPNHSLYASKAAIPSLLKKGVTSSETGILALEQNTIELPPAYSFLFPPGHRAGDVWLKKNNADNTSLWVTCDSFLNYARTSNQFMARTLQKLLDAAPGLKISQVVKWFILDDREAFRVWVLGQLEKGQPSTLIPSHGEICQSEDLSSQLTKLITDRL